MAAKAKKAKVGVIKVHGGGLPLTQIPIEPGWLIRIKARAGGTAFHVTTTDGKNITVFMAGDMELVNIERPREVRRGKAKSN